MNYSISRYDPSNESKTKEPFSVSIQSSIFDDVDSLFSPTCRTFSTESAPVFLERKISNSKLYRKTFDISLSDAERVPIGGMSFALYLFPLMAKEKIDISCVLPGGEDPISLIESEVVHAMPALFRNNSVSNETPCLFIRAIQIAREKRNNGYGRYLFKNYETFLRGCFGIEYGTVLAVNSTFLLKDDADIINEKLVPYYDTQQGILNRWLDKDGFKKCAWKVQGLSLYKKET